MTPNRFPTVNWVPKKVEVPVILPEGPLTLDKYLGHGMQPGQHALPESADGELSGVAVRCFLIEADFSRAPYLGPAEPVFDAGAMDQLSSMGFPGIRCKRALLATGNNGNAEAAMEWLFAHMDDAGSFAALATDSRLSADLVDV